MLTKKPKKQTVAFSAGAIPQTIDSKIIKQLFAESLDIVINDFNINNEKHLCATVVYVDGLVNTALIDDFVLKPLIQERYLSEAKSQNDLIGRVMDGTVYHNRRTLCNTLPQCLEELLSGSVVVVFDKTNAAVAFEVKGFEKRGITEPTNENVLKGSKEAFIEVVRANTSMVRRRIQSPNLVMEHLKIGKRSHTTVCVVSIKGITNKQIVAQIKQKLNKIDIDGVSSVGEIEAFLLDKQFSIFPQILYTERVDKFCGNILEGRVGILIDGFPNAFILPVDINCFLQAPEDYSLNYISSSLFRILRYFCALAALILPAFYISITTFHPEMIPTTLATSIISTELGTPFPVYLEVIFMLIAFEVLMEAGLRLPKAVGSAVSIVGALVVGDAAISASILSPGVVIIIATAGIAGFVIPSQDMSNAVRICRFFLVLLSTIGGLYTVTLGVIAILYHFCCLEVSGTPYLSPFVANEGKQVFSDTLFRQPWFSTKYRPKSISPEDEIRMGGQQTEGQNE